MSSRSRKITICTSSCTMMIIPMSCRRRETGAAEETERINSIGYHVHHPVQQVRSRVECINHSKATAAPTALEAIKSALHICESISTL